MDANPGLGALLGMTSGQDGRAGGWAEPLQSCRTSTLIRSLTSVSVNAPSRSSRADWPIAIVRCPSVSSQVWSHLPSHDGFPHRGHHDEAERKLRDPTGLDRPISRARRTHRCDTTSKHTEQQTPAVSCSTVESASHSPVVDKRLVRYRPSGRRLRRPGSRPPGRGPPRAAWRSRGWTRGPRPPVPRRHARRPQGGPDRAVGNPALTARAVRASASGMVIARGRTGSALRPSSADHPLVRAVSRAWARSEVMAARSWRPEKISVPGSSATPAARGPASTAS